MVGKGHDAPCKGHASSSGELKVYRIHVGPPACTSGKLKVWYPYVNDDLRRYIDIYIYIYLAGVFLATWGFAHLKIHLWRISVVNLE